jgi:hypothetical protein
MEVDGLLNKQVKKRMTMDIIVYPSLGVVDGDTEYAAPITLKGYITANESIIFTREGKQVVTNTTVYLNGTEVNNIHEADLVDYPIVGKQPVQKINYYPSLTPNVYELLEVLI